MEGDMLAYMNNYDFYTRMLDHYTHVLNQPLPLFYEDIRRSSDEDHLTAPPPTPRRRWRCMRWSRVYDAVPTDDAHCDSV